jgi:general secretion pathway protein B
MSYILDALKKAEKERGLAEIPTIDTVHDAPTRKKTGVWIAAGCGAVCLIAIVWLLFSTLYGPIESEAPTLISLNPDTETKDSDPPPESREFVAQDFQRPVLDLDAIALKLSFMEIADDYFAAEAETDLLSDEAMPDAVMWKPPQLTELSSLREIAESMKINLLSYSDIPDRRVVFINGVRYVEGAPLQHGCVLESITPSGVVLKRGEETFILHVRR